MARVNLDGLELSELLGSGGMADVYLSRQEHLDRPVAVKVFRPARHDELELFLREARVFGRIGGLTGIVSVHDARISPDGRPYLVMQYCDGGSLGDRLREESMAWREALGIFRKLGVALAAVHDAGVVHRDVKPDNIMFHGGEPLLSDFGIGGFTNSTSGRASTTIGYSRTYVAPEILRGAKADQRSDVYSLGATLWTALSGTQPFGAQDPDVHPGAVLLRVLNEPMERLDHVPGPLGDLVVDMTAKAPEHRPDAAALMQTLDEMSAADLDSAATSWNSHPGDHTTTRLVTPPTKLPVPTTAFVGLDLDGASPTLSFLTDAGVYVHDLPAATTRMLDADLLEHLDELLPGRNFVRARYTGQQLHRAAERPLDDRTVRLANAIAMAATAVHLRRRTPSTDQLILAAGLSPSGWVAGIVETGDGVVEVKSIATAAFADSHGLAGAVEAAFVRAFGSAPAGTERPTIDIVATLNRWDDPDHVQRLLSEPASEIERGDLVAEGLAWHSGVFTGEVKDLLLVDVIAEELSLTVADGPPVLALPACTRIPTRRSMNVTLDGDRSLWLLEGDVIVDRFRVPESVGNDITITLDIDANASHQLECAPQRD